MTDPELRILDAAERLFADLGLAATSVRAITLAARVNSAAVHYYYRSKAELIVAVCTRRLEPMNRQRLEMLDCCERLYASGQLPLEEVIEAFVVPMLRGNSSPRLVGRICTEPEGLLPEAVFARMNEISRRFDAAVRRALPDRNPADLCWAMHLIAGMLTRIMLSSAPSDASSAAAGNQAAVEEVSFKIVTFACAGLRSLPADRAGKKGSCVVPRAVIANSRHGV